MTDDRPTVSSDLDIPLPPCTCGNPPESHHMATHFVRAQPQTGPMTFARVDTTEHGPDPRDVIARVIRDEIKRYPVTVPSEFGVPSSWGASEFTIGDALLAAIDTDPAVADALITGHTDAILAALTRAGVLDEQSARVWTDPNTGDKVPWFSNAWPSGATPHTRLLSQWQEAT